jgi:hypothetical protein
LRKRKKVPAEGGRARVKRKGEKTGMKDSDRKERKQEERDQVDLRGPSEAALLFDKDPQACGKRGERFRAGSFPRPFNLVPSDLILSLNAAPLPLAASGRGRRIPSQER